MKTKLPNLKSFLPKQVKQSSKDEKKKLDFSTAFVYQGHLIGFNNQTLLIFDLKEYMKIYMKADDDEGEANAINMVKKVVEYLEGKALSADFFSVFAKMNEIINVDDDRIYVSQNDLHSEFYIDATYDVELLEKFLSKIKIMWNRQRTEQQGYYGFSMYGNVYSTLHSVLGPDMAGDSIVFERTTDDQVRFSFAHKEFIFGISVYSLDGEQSMTKFQSGTDFFESNVK